jgi:hypothetical protein
LEIGNEVVQATLEHPFWQDGIGWRRAGELTAGDRIQTISGVPATVTHAEHRLAPQTVFNIEVTDAHTYFVSPTKLLVHNACKVYAVKELAGLETLGTRIPGGRKIIDTLPQGITDVKNAQGTVFKSVHTPPSHPHAGMTTHTHPNYRNVLPDGSIRSGVSKDANQVTRQDIIDAVRDNAQRTGGR